MIINNKSVRLLDNKITLVQYNLPAQVILKGHLLNLSKEQKKLVSQYLNFLQQELPEYLDLIIDGGHLTRDWVKKTILMDKNTTDAVSLLVERELGFASRRFSKAFKRKQGFYYINKQRIEGIGAIFDSHFENHIKPPLYYALRTKPKLFNNVNINNIKNWQAPVLSKLNISPQSLRLQSKELCQKLVYLEHLETRIQQSIKPLAKIDLISLDAR